MAFIRAQHGVHKFTTWRSLEHTMTFIRAQNGVH